MNIRKIKNIEICIRDIEQSPGDFVFCNLNLFPEVRTFADIKSFRLFLFNSVPLNTPYIFMDKTKGEIILRLEKEIYNLLKQDNEYKLTFYQDRERSDSFQESYSTQDVIKDLRKMIIPKTGS